jgi:large-conductance mechanosensitive channel
MEEKTQQSIKKHSHTKQTFAIVSLVFIAIALFLAVILLNKQNQDLRSRASEGEAGSAYQQAQTVKNEHVDMRVDQSFELPDAKAVTERVGKLRQRLQENLE